jgi:hypothetical protein
VGQGLFSQVGQDGVPNEGWGKTLSRYSRDRTLRSTLSSRTAEDNRLETVEQVAQSIKRAATIDEDVFNLVIAFNQANLVSPTRDELCKMIDILHYKKKGTTARSNIQYVIDRLYKAGYFLEEPHVKGKYRRTAGRIIVADAEWNYLGAGYGKK